jgi:hypothetical protein
MELSGISKHKLNKKIELLAEGHYEHSLKG